MWQVGVNSGRLKISNLRVADDTTLIAASQNEICELLESIMKLHISLILILLALTVIKLKLWLLRENKQRNSSIKNAVAKNRVPDKF